MGNTWAKKNREHNYVNEEHIGEKRRGNKIGNKIDLNGNSGGTRRGGNKTSFSFLTSLFFNWLYRAQKKN